MVADAGNAVFDRLPNVFRWLDIVERIVERRKMAPPALYGQPHRGIARKQCPRTRDAHPPGVCREYIRRPACRVRRSCCGFQARLEQRKAAMEPCLDRADWATEAVRQFFTRIAIVIGEQNAIPRRFFSVPRQCRKAASSIICSSPPERSAIFARKSVLSVSAGFAGFFARMTSIARLRVIDTSQPIAGPASGEKLPAFCQIFKNTSWSASSAMLLLGRIRKRIAKSFGAVR